MTRSRGRSWWVSAGSIGVCAMATLLVIGLITMSHGFPTQEVVLDDGGVWVTDDAGPYYGRVSVTAQATDLLLNPPTDNTANGASLDIFQDGTSIVARIISAGVLVPVDPRTGTNVVSDEVAVAPTSRVAQGGGSTGIGSIAVVDIDTGEIRAARFHDGTIPDLSNLDPSNPPLAAVPLADNIDPDLGTDVTVGVDGTVYVASASGQLVTLTPEGMGFAEPETTMIASRLLSVEITAIGSTLIAADPVAGTVLLPLGPLALDPNDGLVLQQSGPDASFVVVATKTQLISAPLDASDMTVLTDMLTDGDPAHPVSMSGCVYGAWARADGVMVRVCSDDVEKIAMDANHGEQANAELVKPEFRVNRGRIMLNDLATGRVFDIDLKQSIEEWSKIQPYEDPTATLVDCTQSLEGAVPKAIDDEIGVRPDRLTPAYVLDNDMGICGQVLSVVSVSEPEQGTAKITPDGQELLVSLPASSPPQTLTYTVQDVAGNQATARVTVEVHDASVNSPPYHAVITQQESLAEKLYPVASQSVVSVPVAGLWRDPDGDPITVLSASLDDVSLPVTPQGLIRVIAPRVAGNTVKEVTYTVSDGVAPGVGGTTSVTVLGSESIEGVAPQAMPDVIRGKVGTPISFMPLANDIPGSDPLHSDAGLTLGATVGSLVDVDVQTDQVSGRVTGVADEPGSYQLSYTAAYGPSLFSQGTIRLDVTEEGNDAPVAMPDSVAVRGDTAVTIDILANDIDPAGNVLTVQSATVGDSTDLQVAVYLGRWLRVKAASDQMLTNPQVIHYTVTNGITTAESDVVVTQLPAVNPDRAILTGDYANVRAGSQTMIPVLDNDASESGSPLVVTDNVEGMTAGMLRVTDGSGNDDPGMVGRAVVVGNKILFIAPTSVEAMTTVTFDYQAGVALQTPATATVSVTIMPDSEVNNHAPTPRDIEARAVAGETLTVPVDVYGVDSDGDPVTVTGLGSAPKYGRVTSLTMTSLTYEAFPSQQATGSDSFTYVVMDKWGATGVATVRIGLAPPSQVQPPVAVDDVVTASYGAAVEIHPKTNDLIPIGDMSATVGELTNFGPLPDGVSQDSTTPEVVFASAPMTNTDPALTIPYALTGAGGVGPAASMIVRAQDLYNNPPRVYDHVATVTDEGTIDVDALDNAWDVDGKKEDLRVTAVGTGGTLNTDGTIHLEVSDHVQMVWFEVTDGMGGVSAAVIFVPSPGLGRPNLVADGLITMDADSLATIDVNDYITSPRGTIVRLTTPDMVWVAPGDNMETTIIDNTHITIASRNAYTGPAALTVEVVDSSDPNDPTALRGVVSIPIQVGEPTPVMWCPDGAITVTPGGHDVPLDIASMCHVWVPNTVDPAGLVFTSSWAQSINHVNATSNAHVLSVTAAGSAVPGSVGALTVSAVGYSSLQSTLTIQVVTVAKPTLTVTNIPEAQGGLPVTTRMAMRSPLPDAHPTIVSVDLVSGPDAHVSWNGTTITVTPAVDAHGTTTLRVTASDVTDPSRTDRQVIGSFTITVFGAPDPPSPPQPDREIKSQTASLTYTPGADNGAAIDGYEVDWTGAGTGSKSCGASTRCEVSGLMNSTSYHFRVRAHNKAGWSDWSAPGAVITPGAVPGPVATFDTSEPSDHSLLLTWTPSTGDWSAVTGYTITYGNQVQRVPAGQTSLLVNGLDNNMPYTFTILAENEAGLSTTPVTAVGQSAGKPSTPSNPKVTYSDLGASAQVTVSWDASDPNGPGPVKYGILYSYETVIEGPGPHLGSPVAVLPTTQNKMIQNQVSYDGHTYTYSIEAENSVNVTKPAAGDAKVSDGATVSWTAVGAPAAWGVNAVTAVPTGANGGATITVNYPESRGKTTTLKVAANGKTQTITNLSAAGGTTLVTLAGLPNGSATDISVFACNESDVCNSPATTTVTTFGPLGAPTLTQQESSVLHQLCVTATGDGNGQNATLTLSASGAATGSTTASGAGQITTGSLCVDAGAEHTSVTFTASIVSDATTPMRSAPTPATLTLTTPWDPLEQPTLQVRKNSNNAGDYAICVNATGQPRSGVPATLTVTSPQNSSFTATDGPKTSTLTIDTCFNVGAPNTSITFVASITDAIHPLPNSASGGATTNATPYDPKVTISKTEFVPIPQPTCTPGPDENGGARVCAHWSSERGSGGIVTVTTSGFSSTVTCTLTVNPHSGTVISPVTFALGPDSKAVSVTLLNGSPNTHIDLPPVPPSTYELSCTDTNGYHASASGDWNT